MNQHRGSLGWSSRAGGNTTPRGTGSGKVGPTLMQALLGGACDSQGHEMTVWVFRAIVGSGI